MRFEFEPADDQDFMDYDFMVSFEQREPVLEDGELFGLAKVVGAYLARNGYPAACPIDISVAGAGAIEFR